VQAGVILLRGATLSGKIFLARRTARRPADQSNRREGFPRASQAARSRGQPMAYFNHDLSTANSFRPFGMGALT
jgi:hypothetical protein